MSNVIEMKEFCRKKLLDHVNWKGRINCTKQLFYNRKLKELHASSLQKELADHWETYKPPTFR